MSLKSDRWIIGQNRIPTHRFVDRKGNRDKLVGLPYSQYEQQVINEIHVIHKAGTPPRRHVAFALRKEELDDWKPMIEGAVDKPVRYVDKGTGEPVDVPYGEAPPEHVRKVISYGVSSYGYDVRIKGDPEQIKVFTNVFMPEIDPKRMSDQNFATPFIRVDEDGARYVLIPAHSYIQAPTMEYFRIPRDVLVIVLGKSTYARSALICNVTPIEPEFEGEVVIEVANVTNSPVRCYLEEGIAQFVFLQGDEECLRSYKDKMGKYQGQRGLTLARV
ncbi:Deoxycytidine triphosphate deaminase [compost metagenome]